MAATPWDIRAFVFSGEVVHGKIPVWEWTNNYFYQSDIVRVPETAEVNVMLAVDPDKPLVGPFDAGDAGTELVRVRNLVYFPPHYVGMILSTPMTPCEAWDTVGAQILAEDTATKTACEPVLRWLKVCLT